MSYDLEILAKNRRELLLAEVGALLHNLGKLGQSFVFRQLFEATRSSEFHAWEEYVYRNIVGVLVEYQTIIYRESGPLKDKLRGRIAEFSKDKNTSYLSQSDKDWLKSTRFNLSLGLQRSMDYCLGDFIELQQDDWYVPHEKRGDISILGMFETGSPATELLEASHHSASGGEKEDAAGKVKQNKQPVYAASVFGHETELPIDELDALRNEFLKLLLRYVQDLRNTSLSAVAIAERRRRLLYNIKPLLATTVADTQRPINDVTLWDITTSVAALHKAALAQELLQPVAPPKRDNLKWCILSISFDGPGFLEQSHHVTDLLGRQRALFDALDGVRDILEVLYPLGNEIYRDEYGSLFVIPSFEQLHGKSFLDLTAKPLASQAGESVQSLLQLLREAFVQSASEGTEDRKDLAGDMTPAFEVWGPYTGKQINIATPLSKRLRPNQPSLDQMRGWWVTEQAEQKDLCSVCGLRPQGFGAPTRYYATKAEKRNVCFVCLQRRERRSQNWLTDPRARKCTIWIDEVADRNGYAALIAGRFELSRWLNGSEIERGGLPASFARIQRTWRTTQEFWPSIDSVVPQNGNSMNGWVGQHLVSQMRLRIESEIDPNLGDFHVYEIEFRDRRIAVVWNPEEGCFYTAENLNYLAAQWQLALPDELARALQDRQVKLFEPSGYGRASIAPIELHLKQVTVSFRLEDNYKPYIHLLASPSAFMALVPGDKAMQVAQEISSKYFCEMRCVLGRLPFALGLVYFGRQTPLRAVLDAARRMLNMPLGTEPRFDYEFLDTSARRYEIQYDSNGRRQTSEKQHRPYLLTELEQFRSIWNSVREGLATSQAHQIVGLIETKRQEWHATPDDPTFVQFVRDVFNNAAWLKGRPAPDKLESLTSAAVRGMLADVLEVHFSIMKEKTEQL